MPQSLSFLLVHLVFSTKDRLPLIGRAVRDRLHAFLAGTARTVGCECFRVGGTADHVHLALRLSRTLSLAQLVEDLKTSSSKWIKEPSAKLGGFAWQRGYGAFSVGPGDREALLEYIDGQENTTGPEPFRTNFARSSANITFPMTKNMFGIDGCAGPSALIPVFRDNLGRCPRLVCGAPLALKNKSSNLF